MIALRLTNSAERAIRTGKNHLISSLATCHVTFPPDLWHLLLPTLELTLNSMRRWAPDPTKSARTGMYGYPFDFHAHPVHPVGQLCVAHVAAQTRKSWDQHGVRAHWLGPAPDHYRCSWVFVSTTQSPRHSHSVDHYPDPLFHWALPETPPPLSTSHPLRPHPTPDGSDLLGKEFIDPDLGRCIVSSLSPPILLQPGTGNLTPGLRLSPGYHHALSYYDPSGKTHVSSVPEVAHWVCTLPPPALAAPVLSHAPSAPSAGAFPNRALSSPSVPSAPLVHIPSARSHLNHFPGNFPDTNVPSDFLNQIFFGNNYFSCDPFFAPAFTGALSAMSHSSTSRPLETAPFALPHVGLSLPMALRQYFSLQDFPPPMSTSAGAHGVVATGPIPHRSIPPPTYTYPDPPGTPPALPAPPTLGLDHHGRPLTWTSCLSGPNRDTWLDLSGAELVKLVRTTGTLAPCLKPSKKATYYNQVPAEKWKSNQIVRRVRGTGGGDRIVVNYSVATPTANLPTVKCIFHATVSEDSFFGVIDITDFYLGSPMPSPEFLKLYTQDYRPELLDELGITPHCSQNYSRLSSSRVPCQ